LKTQSKFSRELLKFAIDEKNKLDKSDKKSKGSQENSEGSQENSEGSEGSEENSEGSEGSEGTDISTDLDIITQKNINEAFINHEKDINSKSNRNAYIVKNNTDIDIDLDNIIVSPQTIHDLLRSGKGDYTKN